MLTDQCNKHNLVSYIHTYVHTGITQIQKFVTMMVGCGVSHKNTKYTAAQKERIFFFQIIVTFLFSI